MNRIVAIIVFSLLALGLSAQNYLRPVDHSSKKARKSEAVVVVERDTVFLPEYIVVAGFEKPLRSMRESMFVTNNGPDELCSLGITIDYLDMQGRGLHQAKHVVGVDIPPGATRRIDVKAFDRSSLFYYHLSPKPKRATLATPFDVRVAVDFITKPKNSEK